MYEIKDGIIVSPGKFEGEPAWILKLYDMVMDGMADDSINDGNLVIDCFKLDAEMSAITGLPAQPDVFVCVWSNGAGFVSHAVKTAGQLAELQDFSDIPTIDYAPEELDFEASGHYDSGY